MEMGADLDGAVTGVGNFQLNFAPTRIGDNVGFGQQIFTGIIGCLQVPCGLSSTGFSLWG